MKHVIRLTGEDLELLILACDGFEGHESFDELAARLRRYQEKAMNTKGDK